MCRGGPVEHGPDRPIPRDAVRPHSTGRPVRGQPQLLRGVGHGRVPSSETLDEGGFPHGPDPPGSCGWHRRDRIFFSAAVSSTCGTHRHVDRNTLAGQAVIHRADRRASVAADRMPVRLFQESIPCRIPRSRTSAFPHRSSARSRPRGTRRPPRSRPRPCHTCSPAAICSAVPRPAPERPPRSRCR